MRYRMKLGIRVLARLQMRFEPNLPRRHDLSSPIAHPQCFGQHLVVVGSTRTTRLGRVSLGLLGGAVSMIRLGAAALGDHPGLDVTLHKNHKLD